MCRCRTVAFSVCTVDMFRTIHPVRYIGSHKGRSFVVMQTCAVHTSSTGSAGEENMVL